MKKDIQRSSPSAKKKCNYGTGAGWAIRRDQKRKNRGKGQTPGSTKSEFCKAGWRKKYFAKTSRSYKHPNYSTWLAWCRSAR